MSNSPAESVALRKARLTCAKLKRDLDRIMLLSQMSIGERPDGSMVPGATESQIDDAQLAYDLAVLDVEANDKGP